MARPPYLSLAVTAALAVILPGARAQTSPAGVHLGYWDGPAVLQHTASGPSFYYLTAGVTWDSTATQVPNAYEAAVTLPDGRVERRPLYRDQGPGRASHLTFIVPVEAVTNLRPEQVKVTAEVIGPNGVTVSRAPLTALASQFPAQQTKAGRRSEPYRWPAPLTVVPGTAALLPTPAFAGDGAMLLRFVRVFPRDGQPGYFLSTTEVNMRQVNAANAGITYGDNDLQIGETRVDLDAPAYRLTPAQALAYLEALGKTEGLGLTYRLPNRSEWEVAARAGRGEGFWWGDDPKAAAGRFQGNPPPAEGRDIPGRPDQIIVRPTVSYSLMGYKPNPFGLWHTYGNLTEWAADPSRPGTFWKLGGSFATETADFHPADLAIEVGDANSLKGAGEEDPPQWVGVRPASSLTAEEGARIIRERLASNPALAKAQVTYDPDRATAALSGLVETWDQAAAADRLLARSDKSRKPLWFLAAVDNQLAPMRFGEGHLAEIGPVSGPVSVRFEVGYWFFDLPIDVRWGADMPVEGTTWWLDIFQPGGQRIAQERLAPAVLGMSPRLTIVVPKASLDRAGLAPGADLEAALNIGPEAAQRSDDPSIVSNRWLFRWDPARVNMPRSADPRLNSTR